MEMDDIDDKLLDFFTGELTEEEEEQVKKWIARSLENHVYFEQLQLTYLRQRWSFREKLIRKHPSSTLFRDKKRGMPKFAYVAAAVLLLVGLFGIYQIVSISQDRHNAGGNEIISGSYKAKLHLSDGKVIQLGEQEEKIQEQGNIEINVNNSGGISYNTLADALPQERWHTLDVERGGEYMVTLSDSTKIWLNSATRLDYPVVFNGEERRVKLQGEAYFQVYPRPGIPFIVEVNDLVVTATGTEFNINSHWNGVVETVLVNGRVNVRSEASMFDLRPFQKAVYNTDSGEMYVKNVDIEEYVAWKNGDFTFNRERLENIMKKLSLWYNCEIVFEQEELKEIPLSGDMKRYGRIENLLYFFEGSTKLLFKIEGKTIRIGAK